jgi:hypothetical protein
VLKNYQKQKNMKKSNYKKTVQCALIILFLHIIFASMLQAQNNTNPVGAIPGTIDVSPMGAASYTIPIDVVPGTQGMQPNLSIAYNSFGGMGLLGMNWNLTGLSAIMRCGRELYYDGKITATQFNENDKFALVKDKFIIEVTRVDFDSRKDMEILNYEKDYINSDNFKKANIRLNYVLMKNKSFNDY